MAADPFLSHITVRKIEETDAEAMMQWAADDRVTASTAWDTYTRLEDAIDFLRNVAAPHPFFKAICLDGRPIGALTVSPNTGCHSCRGELGYVLAADFWGKGIAAHAVKISAPLAFQQLGLSVIEAFVVPENLRSTRVLLKSGFQSLGLEKQYLIFKGEVRDCYRFALYSTQIQLL